MMMRAIHEFGFSTDARGIESLFTESSGYVESFLRRIGAKEVQSLMPRVTRELPTNTT
jgi:hypothetical protein